MQPPTSRILNQNVFQLDVLRGIAVLLVICFHFFEGFSFGWAGVDLFFVLSGFLITGKLIESIGAPDYWSAFYLKRVLRIVPLYYLVLIIFFILLPLIAPSLVSTSLKLLQAEQVYYWTFSINFIYANRGWPTNANLLHLWTIACEMQFYLVWPFVVKWLLSSKKMRNWILVALILFALIFRLFIADLFFLNHLAKYILPFSRIDTFAAGALLYFYFTGNQTPKLSLFIFVVLFSFAAIVSLSVAYNLNWHYSEGVTENFGYSLNAAFWGGILGIFWMRKAFNPYFFRWLALAGKYSYGIYVFHYPILKYAQKLIRDYAYADHIGLIKALAIIVSIGLAVASYELYEKRFIRLKFSFASKNKLVKPGKV